MKKQLSSLSESQVCQGYFYMRLFGQNLQIDINVSPPSTFGSALVHTLAGPLLCIPLTFQAMLHQVHLNVSLRNEKSIPSRSDYLMMMGLSTGKHFFLVTG